MLFQQSWSSQRGWALHVQTFDWCCTQNMSIKIPTDTALRRRTEILFSLSRPGAEWTFSLFIQLIVAALFADIPVHCLPLSRSGSVKFSVPIKIYLRVMRILRKCSSDVLPCFFSLHFSLWLQLPFSKCVFLPNLRRLLQPGLQRDGKFLIKISRTFQKLSMGT